MDNVTGSISHVREQRAVSFPLRIHDLRISLPPSQGAEDHRYGNRLSERPAVQHHSEGRLSPRDGRASVSVPICLRVHPADRGDGDHRAVQVLPKIHAQKER